MPGASFGATSFSIVATHASPMPEKLVRIAGAPDDDAVEVGRVALRHQHAFASARRTAGEVRMFGWLAVMLRDDVLGDLGDAADGLVAKSRLAC